MSRWTERFRNDPCPPLLSTPNPAVSYFARKNLLDEDAGPVEGLWTSNEVRGIARRQRPDGSWSYASARAGLRDRGNYDQIETYRRLGQLVEKYALTKDHPAIRRAARFLFRFQTQEGDFRGIYGNQYTPNSTAGITELLAKAGYADDPRIEKTFRWLLAVRQDDGGWAIPFRTLDANITDALRLPELLQADPSRPSSLLVTGVVLRAFAAHERYRRRKEARDAGKLLISGFFRPDAYPDRKAAAFWTAFSFPFWFTDLLSSLDSLSRVGFPPQEPRVEEALDWFVRRQREDGLWNLTTLRTGDKDLDLWLGLAICRVFKRFYG